MYLSLSFTLSHTITYSYKTTFSLYYIPPSLHILHYHSLSNDLKNFVSSNRFTTALRNNARNYIPIDRSKDNCGPGQSCKILMLEWTTALPGTVLTSSTLFATLSSRPTARPSSYVLSYDSTTADAINKSISTNDILAIIIGICIFFCAISVGCYLYFRYVVYIYICVCVLV